MRNWQAQRPTARTASVVIAGLLAASCAGSDSSSDEISSTVPASDPALVESDVSVATDVSVVTDVSVATDGPAESVLAAGDFVETQLRLVPKALVDNAESSVMVTFVDVEAAFRQAGLVDPIDLDDEAEIVDGFIELAQPATVENGGTGYGVVQPAFFPGNFGVEEPDEFEGEFGFSPFDVRTVAELSAPPASFSVVSGDLRVADDLVESADGVVTVGSGADDEVNLEDRTTARPLGRPLHLAERDGLVAATRHLSVAAEWAAGGETLADDAAWLAVARQLDASAVAAALIVSGEFGVDSLTSQIEDPDRMALVEAAVQISAPFELVGVGSSRVDGQAMFAAVYHFADDDAAAGEVDNVSAAWVGDSLIGREPLTELISNVRVEQVGSTVTMIGDVGDRWSTRAATDTLLLGDLAFLHR